MEYYSSVLNLTVHAIAPKAELEKLPRRERERLARRGDIIVAGRHLFARKGYHDATLDEVAEAVELGKATLYSYFASKELLFEAVIDDSFTAMRAIGESALFRPGTFEERIRIFIAAEMDFFFRHPSSLRLMMSEAHQLRGRNPMLTRMPLLINTVADAIRDGQSSGEVTPDADPLDLAGLLVNMMYGRVMARIYKSLRTHGDPADCSYDEDRITEVFKELGAEELEERVTRATDLVFTVFFSGIRG
jgi:AcrR family transcriptional regulator